MSAPRLTMQALRSRRVLVPALAVAGAGAYIGAQAFINREVPAPALGGLGPTTLRLKSSEFVTHDTKRLVFEFPDKNAKSGLAFTSSVMAICWPKDQWLPVGRFYTQISTQDKTGEIEFLVKRYPNGLASKHITSLLPGDTLVFWLQHKQFQWTPNMLSKVHLIAGGTGVTPLYQLTQGILTNKEENTKVNLIIGVNSEQEILLREELENFKKMFPDRFTYSFVVRDLKEEKDGMMKGYINEEVLKKLVDEVKEDELMLVSGPDPMVDALVGKSVRFRRTGGILKGVYGEEKVRKF